MKITNKTEVTFKIEGKNYWFIRTNKYVNVWHYTNPNTKQDDFVFTVTLQDLIDNHELITDLRAF